MIISANVRSLATAAALAGVVGVHASRLEAASADVLAGAVQAAPADPTGFLGGAGGVRLHYRILGTSPDTVVVVHGGPGAGINSVLPDFAPLADELTLIFYDQRGGGRSTLPPDTADLRAELHVADLDSVRAHFGIERMKLLAHSFGAVLVARYAQEHPDRVDGIVLHGATGPFRAHAARLARASPPGPDTALSRRAGELLGILLEGTAEDPVGTCREYERVERNLAEARGERAQWRSSSCEMPPEAVRYYFRHTAQLAPRTFGDWDFRGALQAVRAPVLVVAGTRDSLHLRAQQDWADAYPNGRLLRVAGAGKPEIAERPDVVLPEVAEFLADPAAAGESRGEPELLNRVTNAYPAWSPDGEWIAYMSTADGDFDVYAVAPRLGERRQLTDAPARDGTPVWSPDGSRIAFQSFRDGHSQIYVMDADGSNQRNLSNGSWHDEHPFWSADGERILFASNRNATGEAPDNVDLYVMNADGSGVRQITRTPEVETYPSWSPDGSRIAVRKILPDGNWEVVVMGADGSNARAVAPHPAADGWPAWSPDGRRIVFSSERAGTADLWLVELETGELRRLTWDDEADERQPWFSPDGGRVAYARYIWFPDQPFYEASEIFVIGVPAAAPESAAPTESAGPAATP